MGIVAPDLAGVRDRLEFRLDDVLHPALIRPDAAEVPRCFNFSLGRGAGRSAADPRRPRSAGAWAVAGPRSSRAGCRRAAGRRLVGAGEAEADGRARLDAALRRDLPYFTTLPALIRLADGWPSRAAALPAERWRRLPPLLTTMPVAPPRQLLPGAMGGVFRASLASVGWPGDRPLSSHEFQAHRAFGEVLDGFGRFDSLLGPLAFAEAVRRLSQLCRQRLFPAGNARPAGDPGARRARKRRPRVRCAVGHGHERRPLAAAAAAQSAVASRTAAGGRAAHASAEVELDFAQRVHARLLLAAPDVHFSYAQADGNRVLRPSPLIAGITRGPCDVPQGRRLAGQETEAPG
jgi:hypothetical protein